MAPFGYAAAATAAAAAAALHIGWAYDVASFWQRCLHV